MLFSIFFIVKVLTARAYHAPSVSWSRTLGVDSSKHDLHASIPYTFWALVGWSQIVVIVTTICIHSNDYVTVINLPPCWKLLFKLNVEYSRNVGPSWAGVINHWIDLVLHSDCEDLLPRTVVLTACCLVTMASLSVHIQAVHVVEVVAEECQDSDHTGLSLDLRKYNKLQELEAIKPTHLWLHQS